MPKTDASVKLKRSRVEVPEDIHAKLRLAAAKHHVPLSSIVERILRRSQNEIAAVAEQLKRASQADVAA